ncbi:MAG: hypothetical protein ABJH05_16615 [Fulvivirga sp.]
MKKSLLVLAVVLFQLPNLLAQNNDVKVYNFHDAELLSEFEKLDLDQSHQNLLNPQVSKDSINEVIKSWSALHQAIGSHLKSADFHWNVETESISIVHKIYFHNDGKIKAHFFRVLTPELPEEVIQAFSDQLEVFGKTYQLNITREDDFAQCGKARYTISD